MEYVVFQKKVVDLRAGCLSADSWAPTRWGQDAECSLASHRGAGPPQAGSNCGNTNENRNWAVISKCLVHLPYVVCKIHLDLKESNTIFGEIEVLRFWRPQQQRVRSLSK